MALTAQQQYEVKSKAFALGQEILARVIVLFGQIVWFTYNFIKDGIKMALGK